MTAGVDRVQFTSAEAAPLAHAYVHAVARELGIRTLSIKGPVLTHHGLRPVRVSADADVWADPAEWSRLSAALLALGWGKRTEYEQPKLLGEHSITLVRDGWPTDIDLHRMYPGCFAPAHTVFEAAWSRRTQVEIAGMPVAATDRAVSLVIMALHALRDLQIKPDLAEYRLAERALREPDAYELRREVGEFAVEAGAAHPLAELLDGIVDDLGPEPEAMLYWRINQHAYGRSGTTNWLVGLRFARWRDKPAILWRAVWPNRSYLAMEDARLAASTGGRLRLRLRRLRRGIRRMPTVISKTRRLKGTIPLDE